ncbi:baculoviral IAP repeat-containing protein 7-like [Saccostrea echinata]|uniref:baculoviral IAP repeat-containing protein 7-like n=1 Tax=Saccostrea echinata TaxID=191078 RepID=UPI002A84192E|nr:baculoviral IAP repeat-containing protein 7-like [Saccostrea echinata]
MDFQMATHHIAEKNGDDAYADPSRHGSDEESLSKRSVTELTEENAVTHETSNTVENILWTEAAQTVLAMEYLPVVVQNAINSIFRDHGANSEFSAQDILEEIEKFKRRENVTDTSLKVPSFPENKRNEATPKEPEELLKQNDEMRKMLLCKSCGTLDGHNVIVNCGHLICNECESHINVCSFCEQEIKKVIQIHFTENSSFE